MNFWKMLFALLLSFVTFSACSVTPKKEVSTTSSSRLLITRVFDAPKNTVWKTWTEPDRIKRWWGPKNFTAPVVKNDLRVGGKYLYAMKSPDGKTFWSGGTYREVITPVQIVATDMFADENGQPVDPKIYGMPPEMPQQMIVTVAFKDLDGKTQLTIEQDGFPEGPMMEMAKTGWNESLDKFDDALKNGKTTSKK